MISESNNRVFNIFNTKQATDVYENTDCFPSRLVKSIFREKVATPDSSSRRVTWSSDLEAKTYATLLEIVNDLLKDHSSNFDHLLSQLTYDEKNIGEVFKGVVKEVLQGDNKGITWARIGVLFAFSVIMAKSCLPRSSPQFLDNFGTAVGILIEQQAGTWIQKQGGWEHLNVAPQKSSSEILMNVLGLGTTVLGAAITIIGYGLTTSAFTSILKRS